MYGKWELGLLWMESEKWPNLWYHKVVESKIIIKKTILWQELRVICIEMLAWVEKT